MKILKLCSLLLLLITACKSETAPQSYWDENNGEFSMSELKLCYIVPTAVENWSIANPDSLVSGLKFFGFDSSTGICISIVAPTLSSNQSKLNAFKIRELLHDIICQYPKNKILKFNPVIEPCTYFDADNWRFNAELSILEQQDTVSVFHSGYFFYIDNKPIGILATFPISSVDSIDYKNKLQDYFDGLRKLK